MTLLDKQGAPVRFAMPDPVLRALHNIDQQAAGEIAMADPAVSGSDRSSPLAEGLNHRQLALLSHALRHPGHAYTVASHQRSNRIVTQTARTDLLKLVELGLLDQRKRGRAFTFHAPADLGERIAAASVGA